METPSPVQPLPQSYQTAGVMSMPDSQPPPENAPHSSTGQKPPFIYKGLLNQHAQKMRKPPPIYQTQNEGSEHQPRFRTTVWVDGVSYTSSDTFQLRKTSEMDACRVAYIAITQQSKTDALHFIQQEKIFCKSILVEFAAKNNIGKPVYETTHLEASVPTFCSTLQFNGGTYQGECGKSKKEAEQLVARSVVIQYLDSEFGPDMVDIVYCKLRQIHARDKVQEINGIQSGSNVQATMAPATFLSSGAQVLVEPITPADPFVIQPPTPHVSTEPVHPDIPVVTQQPSPQVSVGPGLTPVPSAVINNSCSSVVSTAVVEVPATNNIIPQLKAETAPAQALEYIPLVEQTSNKKRNRKNKKNARKKMRADAQMTEIPATSQLLPFSTPMNSFTPV